MDMIEIVLWTLFIVFIVFLVGMLVVGSCLECVEYKELCYKKEIRSTGKTTWYENVPTDCLDEKAVGSRDFCSKMEMSCLK